MLKQAYTDEYTRGGYKDGVQQVRRGAPEGAGALQGDKECLEEEATPHHSQSPPRHELGLLSQTD